MTNRNQQRNDINNERNGREIDSIETRNLELSETPGPSSLRNRPSTIRSLENKTLRRKKKKKRKSKKSKTKKTYRLDETTGEKIMIIKKTKRRKRRNTKRERQLVPPKTVKKRLAVTLGMCATKIQTQCIPETRGQQVSSSINFQRNQAGIPTLHLFGQRDSLDYFSGEESDEDVSGSLNLLIRRRPNLSDVSMMRRAARRKAMVIAPTVGTSDVLGNILDIQTRFHSKDSVLSLNKDGSVIIEQKDSSGQNNCDVNNKDSINVKDAKNFKLKKTPMYTPRQSSGSSSYGGGANYGNQGSDNRINVNAISTSFGGEIGGQSGGNSFLPPVDFSVPPPNFYQGHNLNQEQEQNRDENKSSTQNSESELDIYSDIETVTTSR